MRDISIGADTRNYYNAFSIIREFVPWSTLSYGGWEKGYVFLNKLIGNFFPDGRALLIILSIAILVPFFKWIYEESTFPMMALLIFVSMGFWISATSIYRQWCAMAILTFSYKFVEKKKLVPFLVLVGIAMLFHRSAAIFLIVYFMYLIKIQVNTLFLVTMFASIMIYALRQNIYTFLNNFTRIPIAATTRGGVALLITLWGVFLIAFFTSKSRWSETKMKLYFRMLSVAVFIQPVVFAFSLWSRIVIYFTPALIMVIPEVFEHVIYEKNNKKFAWPACIIVCVFLYIWYIATLPEQPYMFMQ